MDLALAELGFKVIGLEIDPIKSSKANKRADESNEFENESNAIKQVIWENNFQKD